MGVRGLETYIEERCRGTAFYEVDIVELARKATSSSEATLVVDLMSCVKKFYVEIAGLDVICGGQIKQYVDFLRRFVERFRAVGIRLVFVVDGPSQSSKRETWVKRRYQSWEKFGVLVYDALKRGRYPDLRGNVTSLPSLQTQALVEVVLGCEVVITAGGTEADEDVVRLARSRNAFAILAQDTDYLIYDTGDVAYLSVKHLDFGAMRTHRYDRVELASHLGLHPNQLSLLAMLNGNDVFDAEPLRPFHLWLTQYVRRKSFPSHEDVIDTLPEYIANCGLPTNYDDILKDLPWLVNDVFGDQSLLNEARALIRGYFVKTEQRPLRSTALNWLAIKDSPMSRLAHVKSVVEFGRYESSYCLEDFRESHRLPPSAFLFRALRRRLYGVLLYEKPGALKADGSGFAITVEEWVMSGVGSLDGPCVQQVDLPPAEFHPGLLALRDDATPRVTGYRWALFAHIISPSLEPAVLAGMPSLDLFYPAAVLYYFQHETEGNRPPLLEDWEVDAFIAQHFLLREYTVDRLAAIPFPPNVPDPRGVQLATLYSVRGLIVLSNYVLGCPVRPVERVLMLNNLDGKLFQMVYLDFKHGRRTLRGVADQLNLGDEPFWIKRVVTGGLERAAKK